MLKVRRWIGWRHLSLDIALWVGCGIITLQAIDFDLDILQANGIAPPPTETANSQQNTGNKRKSSQIDVLEIDSSDEDEIDRHVKELKVALPCTFRV